MAITAIYIPHDAGKKAELVSFEQSDIGTMQRYVEGNFDVMDLPQPKASIWFNDEMLVADFPVNYRALFLMWVLYPSQIGLPLRGNVLITGHPNKQGNTLSVPRKLVELLFETARYQVTWRNKGKRQTYRQKIVFGDWPTAFEYAHHLYMNNRDQIEGVEVVPAL